MVSMRMSSAIAGVCVAAALAFTPTLALAKGFSGKVTMDGGHGDDDISLQTIRTVEYGASWDYGSIPFVCGWSNLTSSTRWHSSTVTATWGRDESGSKAPGDPATALLCFKFPTYNAYYNIW